MPSLNGYHRNYLCPDGEPCLHRTGFSDGFCSSRDISTAVREGFIRLSDTRHCASPVALRGNFPAVVKVTGFLADRFRRELHDISRRLVRRIFPTRTYLPR